MFVLNKILYIDRAISLDTIYCRWYNSYSAFQDILKPLDSKLIHINLCKLPLECLWQIWLEKAEKMGDFKITNNKIWDTQTSK